jgi:orotate phosphoribosyltransferase
MSWDAEKQALGQEIAEALYDAGMIRTWYANKPEGWTLISGLWSPLYINLRELGSHPKVLALAGHALARLIREEAPGIDRVIGIASAGVPIAAAIAVQGLVPMGYTRKLEGVKNLDDLRATITQYGQHQLIEGDLRSGEHVALVDDLVTQLNSKLVALEQLRYDVANRGLDVACDTIVVLLDREQGAGQLAADAGLRLLSLIPFKTSGVEWLRNRLTPVEYEVLSDYLADPQKYQDPAVQARTKAQVPAAE